MYKFAFFENGVKVFQILVIIQIASILITFPMKFVTFQLLISASIFTPFIKNILLMAFGTRKKQQKNSQKSGNPTTFYSSYYTISLTLVLPGESRTLFCKGFCRLHFLVS